MSNAHSTYRARQIEGARNYAAADKSDPFAFNRCMTHILNGVADYRTDPVADANYSATPTQVMAKTEKGEEYPVTVYTQRRRP